MEDDFNTPKAIAEIFKLIHKANSLMSENKLEKEEVKEILGFFRKIDKIFNVIFREKPKEKIAKELLDLAKQRKEYRKKGQWEKADEIRREIRRLGWRIEDTKEGPKLKKI